METNSRLLLVFLVLLIVVIILGIKAFTMRDTGIDSVEADIVIPVIEENTNNTIQVDLSEMSIGGLQEYIFKVSNYKGKTTAQESRPLFPRHEAAPGAGRCPSGKAAPSPSG